MKFSGSSGRFEKLKYLCGEPINPVNSYLGIDLLIIKDETGEIRKIPRRKEYGADTEKRYE